MNLQKLKYLKKVKIFMINQMYKNKLLSEFFHTSNIKVKWTISNMKQFLFSELWANSLTYVAVNGVTES